MEVFVGIYNSINYGGGVESEEKRYVNPWLSSDWYQMPNEILSAIQIKVYGRSRMDWEFQYCSLYMVDHKGMNVCSNKLLLKMKSHTNLLKAQAL